MTPKEKLSFIQQKFPELYSLLEMNVPFVVENTEHMTREDAEICNCWIAFYCGKIENPQLMMSLLF